MKMNVKFLDLSATCSELKAEIDDAVKKVLESGEFVLGENVEQFEEEFAKI